MDMMQLIYDIKISVMLLVIKSTTRIMTVEGSQIITNDMAVLQSSRLNEGTYAINAIDGDTTTYSCTKKGSDQWWKVDFGRTVLLRTIYVDPQAGSLCGVNTLTFLTSISGSPGTPSGANRNWSVCASGITFVNNHDSKTISCSNSTYRVARQLAILTNTTAKGLGLNEVQVNDLEPPVMANLSIRNLVQGNTFVKFQFSGWESFMPGEMNLQQYGVFLKNSTGSYQRILTILPNESPSYLLVTITDLLPNTPYQIRITAEILGVLPAFAGDGSDIFNVTTSCDYPHKPQSLDVSQGKYERSSLISLNVSWQMQNYSCDNVSYILVVNGSNFTSTLNQTEPLAEIHDLQPNANYCVSLQVVHNTNMISEAATNCIFAESEPGPLLNLSTAGVNSSCLTLIWDPPLLINGRLIGYQYRCANSISNKLSGGENLTVDTRAVVCGLTAGSQYLCGVSAVNSAGYGSASNVTVRTEETEPGPVNHLRGTSVSISCINLTWDSPENLNGLLRGYQWACSDFTTGELLGEGNSTSASFTSMVCGLSAGNQLLCTVAAVNRAGISPRVSVRVNTNEDDPGPVLNLTAVALSSSCIKLMWEPPAKPNGLITGFQVNCMVNLTNKPDGVDNLTADLQALICDLRAGNLYQCDVRAVNSAGAGQPSSVNLTVFTQEAEDKISPTPEQVTASSLEPVVGGVLGTVSALLVLALIIFFLRKRGILGKWISTQKELGNQMTDLSLVITEKVPYEGGEEQPSGMQISDGNFALGEPDIDQDTQNISIDILVAKGKEDADTIESQFRKLDKWNQGPMTAAYLPANKRKNRYKGIYPYDTHRVVLLRPAAHGTDYINASYLAGFHRDNQYIAAQGPTEASVNDFILMLWQIKPITIVMVTKAEEDGKMKCVQYWPSLAGPSSTYDEIHVETITETWNKDFVIRTLKLTKGDESLLIEHYNYMTWPDHGVPREAATFYLFYRQVMSHTEKSSAPIIVHCSAGVGRTGTFIALDFLLDQSAETGVINPYHCVKLMRERRPFMIQTVEQYAFLHRVIIEAHITKEFHCSPQLLDDRLNLFRQTDRQTPLLDNAIRRELEHISTTLKTVESCSAAAKLSPILNENRNVETLKSDSCQSVLNNDGGGYVNAVQVDGYSEANIFVAIPLPLSDTVNDFWDLVVEQETLAIIQLQSCDVQFRPTECGSTQRIGGYDISCSSIEETDGLRITTITVSGLKADIKLFELSEWTSGQAVVFGECMPDERTFLLLIQSVLRWQQESANKKILVTCLDGSSECGLFICAYNALEMLHLDQEVNIYYSVLTARKRNQRFIKTQDQYLFLYHLLQICIRDFTDFWKFKSGSDVLGEGSI